MKSEHMAEYMRSYRKRNKEILLNLLGNKCKICKSTENLEFDHIDHLSKLDNKHRISNLIANNNFSETLKETEKCQLLCKKCHMLKTKNEKSHSKNIICGEKIKTSKLTNQNVKDIKFNRKNKSKNDIAKEFNVTKRTISNILNNRCWKHITSK